MRAELIVPLNESGISKIFFKAEYLLYLLSGASGGQDCSEIQARNSLPSSKITHCLYKKRNNKDTDYSGNTDDQGHKGLRFITVFSL